MNKTAWVIMKNDYPAEVLIGSEAQAEERKDELQKLANKGLPPFTHKIYIHLCEVPLTEAAHVTGS